MKTKISSLALFTTLSVWTLLAEHPEQDFGPKLPPNILMIAVDDLRPELGCYGVENISSPNIDNLASNGLVFDRAYCQQAVCSPSRTSLMTGLRPDQTKVWDLSTHFRKTIPDVTTLAEFFKNNAYLTQAIGKIFHGPLDDPQSWSRPWIKTPGNPTANQRLAKRQQVVIKHAEKEQAKGVEPGNEAIKWPHPSWSVMIPEDESHHGDVMIANKACEILEEIKDQTFFLAVGFRKPHLPFDAPKRFFDLYSEQSFHLPANAAPPVNVAPPSLHSFGELRAYNDISDSGRLTLEKQSELTKAYHATISFVDEQIGRVLDKLDSLGLKDNTIVVLWSDHGYLLGEYGLWCKHTNFEVATRVPFIMSGPGIAKDSKSSAIVELIDLYPTLVDLCGLPIPSTLPGKSLKPVIEVPSAKHKGFALSQYPRGNLMGYSIRNDRYRYTIWVKKGKAEMKAAYEELYDLELDPFETINIIDQADPDTVKSISNQLILLLSNT